MSPGVQNPSERPKIVLVRGDFLCARNTQYYAPLVDRYDLLGVSVRRTEHDLSLVRFPYVALWSADSVLAKLPPVQKAFDRAFRLRSENLMHIWGLERACQGAALIDVAESFHPYCLQAVRIRKRTSARLVVRHYENIPFAHENLAYRRRVKRLVFDNADALLPCCEMGRKALELEGAPPEKIHVVPMGVDVSQYSPREKSPKLMHDIGLTADDFVVLYAGRLVWEKGVFQLIDAAALLRFLPKLKFVVAGGGPEEEKLRTQLSRSGASGIVRLIGKLPTSSMPDLLSVADVVVVPSIATRKWQEQFGAILIEAMAVGRPLVASDSGAIPEVVGDAGLLVAQGSFPALAEAILAIYEDPELSARLSEAGTARARKLYANEVVADQIARIYERVLSQEGLGTVRELE